MAHIRFPLHNARPFLPKPGRLFKRVRQLQDAKIFLVAANDLHADRKSFRT